MLVVAYCGLAVLAKRLHDRNKSPWWLIVFYVVPGILYAAAMWTSMRAPDDDNTAAMFASLFLLGGMGLTVWAFVELYCLRGTVGDNRYGPDPLAGKV
jgi:uncharacterized membrane protein YhaH (DUF805 family)